MLPQDAQVVEIIYMPLRLGWSFSQDTVWLTNKRGKLLYRRMMNRWLSLSLGPIFFHGVLTEYPWEMTEHRTTQGDGPRSKPALSQTERHTLSLSFLRDQHDSATKPCRPKPVACSSSNKLCPLPPLCLRGCCSGGEIWGSRSEDVTV